MEYAFLLTLLQVSIGVQGENIGKIWRKLSLHARTCQCQNT